MKKILVFGANGLVGSSLVRILGNSFKVIPSTRKDTNLFNFKETKAKIEETEPDIIVNAAAKVGGIVANNTFRTSFIIENLKINLNILENLINKVNIKFINLGSSCIYPLGVNNPIQEADIMSGKLEPTNSPYAMAKLTAIEIGDALNKEYGNKIVNLMPTNLYGPNDNFSAETSHVIPGLISRMYAAKLNSEPEFYIWGTGNPLREFLYVDDLADAVSFVISNDISNSILNVGSGVEISIKDLAIKIKSLLKYEGELLFDSTMPDGNPRKLLDSKLINNLGWSIKTSLDTGLVKTINWYKQQI